MNVNFFHAHNFFVSPSPRMSKCSSNSLACQHPIPGTNVIGATSLEDMVSKLKKPKRVMLLVKAGPAVDAFIEKLVG